MTHALEVHRLSKRYLIGGLRPTTLFERVSLALNSRARGRPKQVVEALHDVSFSVPQGTILGVIGHNGAGKSTLLKVLSRITPPSEGEVRLRGRVGSLLEVGTGFHAELTGRENVFLSGAVLGMSRPEVRARFADIVEFAGVGDYLDEPIKRYSTGMQMRLGFSVAAHLTSEILLVDEVLAVGDISFQEKCIGKMSDVAHDGRTVLFVSHNLHAVSVLTNRCIVFERGRMVFDGDTPQALESYRAIGGSRPAEFQAIHKDHGITEVRVLTSEPAGVHRFGCPLTVRFKLRVKQRPRSGVFSFQVVDQESRSIIHLWMYESETPWCREGDIVLTCRIPRPRLYQGRYTVTAHFSDRATGTHFETLSGVASFEVVMDGMPNEYGWLAGTCTYIEDGIWEVE